MPQRKNMRTVSTGIDPIVRSFRKSDVPKHGLNQLQLHDIKPKKGQNRNF